MLISSNFNSISCIIRSFYYHKFLFPYDLRLQMLFGEWALYVYLIYITLFHLPILFSAILRRGIKYSKYILKVWKMKIDEGNLIMIRHGLLIVRALVI